MSAGGSPMASSSPPEKSTLQQLPLSNGLDGRSMVRPRVERLGRVSIAVLGATVGMWGLCSLWWPYGWDQGCFSFVADTILHGGIPYRDAWDFKGPLTFYVFAALQFVFGTQMWAIRLLDLVLLGASAFA